MISTRLKYYNIFYNKINIGYTNYNFSKTYVLCVIVIYAGMIMYFVSTHKHIYLQIDTLNSMESLGANPNPIN